MAPLLAEIGSGEPTITLVPCGVLGIVPWHAAVVGGTGVPERACEHATIGYAASARQLTEAGSRAPARLAERLVLVGNPNSDLSEADDEVQALRDLRVDRILRQAHGRPLDESGPVVVLASCGSALPAVAYDEALTPATAFMAASATSVIVALGRGEPANRPVHVRPALPAERWRPAHLSHPAFWAAFSCQGR